MATATMQVKRTVVLELTEEEAAALYLCIGNMTGGAITEAGIRPVYAALDALNKEAA